MISTPGLGALQGSPIVRRARRSDVDARPHTWHGQRCVRCQMLAGWPGARLACEGSKYTAVPASTPRCCVVSRATGKRCTRGVGGGRTVCAQHARPAARAARRAALAAWLDARGTR